MANLPIDFDCIISYNSLNYEEDTFCLKKQQYLQIYILA